MLIEIDEGRCIGCGACVADCVGSNLRVEDGLAHVVGRCIMCGHCVAICPTEAVSIPRATTWPTWSRPLPRAKRSTRTRC